MYRSLCSTLVLAVAILVTLHFHVCLGHRLLDRSQNIADVIHGELREDVTCRSFGFGPNCTAHEECAACFLKIPHWEFCVSNKTASHLPHSCSIVHLILLLPSHKHPATTCRKKNAS
eukprot:jgi/Picre1/32096/NNA_007444.t1